MKNKNNYIYDPSLAGASIACALFGITAVALSTQIIRHKTRYCLILAIGAGCESLGYLFRSISASSAQLTTNFALFLLMNMFIILSPLAFMAGLYVIYGRLVRRIIGDNIRVAWLPPRYYAPVFVTCDITSLLIQAAGAGLIVSDNATTATMGRNILMAGLVFGLITFTIFVILVAWFNVLISRARGNYRAVGLLPHWRQIMLPMGVTAACIITRTLYRLIEFAEGYRGHIYTTEWYLYAFDTTFMFIGAAIWIPFFPAKYGLDQHLNGMLHEEEDDQGPESAAKTVLETKISVNQSA